MSCKSRQTLHTHGGQNSASLSFRRNLLLLGGDLYENHSHVPNYLLMSMQNCVNLGTKIGGKRESAIVKEGLNCSEVRI